MRAPLYTHTITTVATLIATLLLWGASFTANASRFGRDGFSGNPQVNGGATCTACHAPGAAMPMVTITGPQTLDAETIAEYTVTIAGGPGVSGGIGVSATDAAGSFEAVDGDVQPVGEELSHTAPKAFSAGSVSFRFRWRAPAYNGPVTLHAAGNSSNGLLDLLGDGIGTQQFTVAVVNGDPEPPPPPPPPPSSALLEPFVSGLDRPVVIAHAGGARLFVVEQSGRIRIIDDGAVAATPFLDITARVDDAGNEQGLLGLAFHPDYPDNGYFYVNYTYDPPSGPDRTRISRFSVGGTPDVADPASELVLMEFAQPFDNHNGGDIHFGPDGYLYIASGDGGSGGDPQDNAQNPNSPLGKLLRIDVDTGAGSGAPDCSLAPGANYGVPPDNAYADGDGGAGCDEVFALGLRNPWRMAFDAQTGDLWIADVGQNAREEVDFVPAGTAAGLNFGWRCLEGNAVYNDAGCDGAYFPPLIDTQHGAGNCSITGGRVYRGGAEPTLAGRYFFSDFCNTAIRTITFDDGEPVVEDAIPAGAVAQPVTFGEDVFGELYVASLTGEIYRIRGAGDTAVSRIATLGAQCLDALSGTTGAIATMPCRGDRASQRWILRGDDGALVNPASGRCVDIPGGSARPGAALLRLRTCNGSAAQTFTATAANELRGAGGLCMEQSRSARRRVQMATCSSGSNQVWLFAPTAEARAPSKPPR